MINSINHPEYYQGKRECIDEMLLLFGKDAVIGFCKCNIYKYKYRAGRKANNSAQQDMKKAEFYMDYLATLNG